jgi:hypothetical protein
MPPGPEVFLAADSLDPSKVLLAVGAADGRAAMRSLAESWSLSWSDLKFDWKAKFKDNIFTVRRGFNIEYKSG